MPLTSLVRNTVFPKPSAVITTTISGGLETGKVVAIDFGYDSGVQCNLDDLQQHFEDDIYFFLVGLLN